MAETKTEHCEEVIKRILAPYGLNPTMLEKRGGYWYVESGNKKLAVREYSRDATSLESMLKWQDYLVNKKCKAIMQPVRTEENKYYIKIDERLFYVVNWIDNEEFLPGDPAHLLLAVYGIGQVHHLSREYLVGDLHPRDVLGLKLIQDRLVELLAYFQSFKGKRPKTDFERIFAEHFSFIYDQGQESLEQMILAGYGSGSPGNNIMLINSFSKQKMSAIHDGVIFLDLGKWNIGPPVMDLALFLNSYLSQYNWELSYTKKLLDKYEEANALDVQEKYMLLALLRFPYRFWLYACQYLGGTESAVELTSKLKRYIKESYWRDKCLDRLDGIMWGGK